MDSDKSNIHHKILCEFFIEVLGLDQRAAEEGAGKMEDAVSMKITERMAQYACNLKRQISTQQVQELISQNQRLTKRITAM